MDVCFPRISGYEPEAYLPILFEEMKRILFVLHSDSDGSPLASDFMRFQGIELETVTPFSESAIPKDLSNFDAIVTVGNTETARDDDFVEKEVELLRQALHTNVPVLGIALGARILAQACYASWCKNEVRRTGWTRVLLTQEGRRDILFYGLPSAMDFFHVHGETLEAPHGALLLARSEECPVQAFRYANAYGLSFHMDVTPVMMRKWAGTTEERERSLRYGEVMAADVAAHTRAIYGNFLWLIDICRSEGYTKRKSRNRLV